MRDEVAVITGAASGIGRHFAEEMARRGYRLVLVDTAIEELNRCFGKRDDLVLIELDIRDREGWRRLFAVVEDRFGRIDYLFNIAGVLQAGYSHEASLDEVDLHLDVNAKGSIYGTLLAARLVTNVVPTIVPLVSTKLCRLADTFAWRIEGRLKTMVALLGGGSETLIVMSRKGGSLAETITCASHTA